MKQKVRELVCEHLSQQCAPCSSYTSCIPRDPQPRATATQVLAAQTLKIASINGLGDTEKLETELEDEIRWEESRHPPREVLGRIRRRCEDILHAKPMLLFIVVLNVIDCLLVIGELTLDFHHISNRFLARTEHTEEFLGRMKRLYSPQLDDLKGVEEQDLTNIFDRFLHSFVFWNVSSYTQAALSADCLPFVSPSNYSFPTTPPTTANNFTSNNNNNNNSYTYYNNNNNNDFNESSNVLEMMLNFSAAPQENMFPMDREHYDVVGTAHALHYASLSILSFLLAETLLKISCVGRRFLKKRMEVFDAVIIVVSFTLDIIFVEGLTILHLQHYVIVLSFLLPWRVLRVLNSLIVAVMVQHRFHLKLLYKQKRKINKQLQESTDSVKTLEKQLAILKQLCMNRGMTEWHINKAIGQVQSTGSQSGLKALSKLVFHAAESFAPMSGSSGSGSGSQTQLNVDSGDIVAASPSPSSPPHSSNLTVHSVSSPCITIQCNGDVEQGQGQRKGHAPQGNGHVLVLREDEEEEVGVGEVHVEDETRTTAPCSRQGSLSRDSGHESRFKEEEEEEEEVVLDSSPVVMVPRSSSSTGKKLKEEEEKEGGEKRGQVSERKGGRHDDDAGDVDEEEEVDSGGKLTFYLPGSGPGDVEGNGSDAAAAAAEKEDSSSTRL
ncbi:uncharacterized protein LOC143297814 isoform X3 [Babylonia areolata]|uniref:uncharacterized protein LOC143297814 isoform X3 n=1 Tax=Babylonia areolata TaxID=304850 RepID=UPI003FD6022C